MTRNPPASQGQNTAHRTVFLPILVSLFMLAFVALQMVFDRAIAAGASQASTGENGQLSELPSPNLVGHGGPVHAIRMNKDKTRVLTGSFDYAMMLWDISGEAPRQLKRFDDHEHWVKAVMFLPGETQALAAGGAEIWQWDLETGKSVHVFKGHTAEISSLDISHDGKWFVSGSSDRTVRLWNLETNKPGPILKGHRGPVNGVAFSGDGKTIYSASYDGTLRTWDAATGEFKRILYKHGFGINAMRRIPKTEQIVFGALNGKALVIDGKSGDAIHELSSNLGPYLSIAIQDKPGLLALSGFQKKGGDVVGVIRVIRIGDWAPIETYDDPRGPIWSMEFGSFGSTLYYGGKDDYVTVWQVSPRKPFESISGPIPRRYEKVRISDPGELQFARKCSLCHTLTSDGGNRAGPTLYKLFGRRAGTIPGYPYSDALKNADIVWNEKTIELLFGLGPDHYTPGTKMPVQRISDPKKREALIAYLKVATEGKGAKNQETQESKEQ